MTEEAVDRGAFGAPTMYFTEEGREEEMFWGSDRWQGVTFAHLVASESERRKFLDFRFDMIAHCFDKQWHGPDPGK